MIRYNLVCDKRHDFESWFQDSAAYDKQAKRISFDRADEIVKGCLIAHAGEVLQGAT